MATQIPYRGEGKAPVAGHLARCGAEGGAGAARRGIYARIQAQIDFIESGEPSRVFSEFPCQILENWSRKRRVVVKAEHLAKGANPHFVVTSLGARQADARTLYEDLYCARGDRENRINEQQLDLFADRTSTQTRLANPIRLYFSSFAYLLLGALRRLGSYQ